MAKAESTTRDIDCLNVEYMRSLVKQYSELGQWSSALFWADAAAATGSSAGEASGDDIWLLASALLAQGELHRAAHTVTSRGLHKRHLLCLGVAMRAILASKEPTVALALMEECDTQLLEPKANDQTHNRALAGVLVTRGRCLSTLERREAAVEAFTAAVNCDAASLEALTLLLDQQSLTPEQEMDLIETLPYDSQLGPVEAAFLKVMYRERLRRYSLSAEETPEPDAVSLHIQAVRDKTAEYATSRARRLIASCEWNTALKLLDTIDPWCSPELRTACLVELRRSTELFTFAHSLVDAYPNAWTSWYAVGCYYYLIGKSEFARRYLSKARSLQPSAGAAWLAYGHSFAADNEHDQAMAAYFKASQLMSGCHLPFLYVGVECSLLNNMPMCERFLLRAANIHNCDNSALLVEFRGDCSFTTMQLVNEPHVAHEAGVAAYMKGNLVTAENLLKRALAIASGVDDDCDDTLNFLDEAILNRRWAATLDALGHVLRCQRRYSAALALHRRALTLRPHHTPTMLAAAFNLARDNQLTKAGEMLHAALAKDPNDVVANQLLDAVVHAMHSATSDEDIPQLPFPAVQLSPAPAPTPTLAPLPTGAGDITVMSDMSMSFD